MTRGSRQTASDTTKEPKQPKPPKTNVLGDQDGEEDEPNAIFNAAVVFARDQTGGGQPASVLMPGQAVPENQNTSQPVSQKPDRAGAGYTKATYRVRDEAIDAVEDMKLVLKRQYGIKALREEIVEEAILAAQRDLLALGEASFLVRSFKEAESQ